MNIFLFLLVIVASFVIVTIGAIAFQITGLGYSLAWFQALSCFSGAGFTTSESELTTGHPQRRKIATVLIVLGNAGFVTMIASVAGALNSKDALWARLWSIILPFGITQSLIPWINLTILIVIAYLVYKLFTNKKFITKLSDSLRKRILKHHLVEHLSIEELVVITGGYGVTRFDVCQDSPILNKTLAESGLREQDITILAIIRPDQTLANPSANTRILFGDELISFGNLANIRHQSCLE